MLNKVFGLNFEEIKQGGANLFHNSVDVVFGFKDARVNVFDF